MHSALPQRFWSASGFEAVLRLSVGFFALCISAPGLAANRPDADTAYRQRVEPYFVQHCTRCHGKGMQEGDLRLDTLPRDFAGMANATHWTDVLDRINSGAMPPAGEPRPEPGEALAVVDWIAGELAQAEADRHAARERVSLYRLTREEYAHTIYDLLGVHVDVADPGNLLPDEDWRGVERIGAVLSYSPAHVEKYYATAERVLAEALPEMPPKPLSTRRDACDLRWSSEVRTQFAERGLADKVRVELWPGARLIGRGGPGRSLPAPGVYRVRVQLSGLKPAKGPAPHLWFYAENLDRVLHECDVVTPEDRPQVVEFETHLPAGGHQIIVANTAPGPPSSPAHSRVDKRYPFTSIAEGRHPWQIKLTDEQGQPIAPFLILDWVEWTGPIAPSHGAGRDLAAIPSDKVDVSQMRDGLAQFAERAFRRPVRTGEVDALLRIVDKELSQGESWRGALKAAFVSILCSSDFCCLVEGNPTSDARYVSDFELASRLSYFLWSSLPDEALLGSARAGRLREPAELRAQFARMLADPKAERFALSFPRRWLQLQKVGMFPPDKKLYPEYDRYLEKCMIGETTAFFGEVLRNNLTLREFLDSDWTMLNGRLAVHYQIPDIEHDRFERVALRPVDQRGGVLTQASILSLSSDGARHRPVHRGKWILESIFGKPPPPPPANVDAIEPTPADAKKSSLRDKLAAHTQNPRCAACHRNIDPLGFAFENYDAIGRWRTHEIVGDGRGDNPAVDAAGALSDGRSFTGATEFKRLLLDDVDRFNAALIDKLATYALRRTMTYDDRKALKEIADQARHNDYRLRDLLEALVTSELFLKR